MKNRNMYSPGCVANWSYTLYPTATYTHIGPGSTVGGVNVSTSSYITTSSYSFFTQGNYNVSSNSVCA
jgi:hypothetical protein